MHTADTVNNGGSGGSPPGENWNFNVKNVQFGEYFNTLLASNYGIYKCTLFGMLT